MAQAASQKEIYTTPQSLEIQFLVSNILHVNADGLVTGQGPVFDQKSMITEHLIKYYPEFQEKREQLRKSDIWSVHKTRLSEDSKQLKWIFTSFFITADTGLEKEMTSLYGKILRKADKHVSSLAIPLLGSGRGMVAEETACLWLLKVLFNFKPSKFLRTVKIVHLRREVVGMMISTYLAIQEQQQTPSSWFKRTFRGGKKKESSKHRLAEIDWRNQVIFRTKSDIQSNDNLQPTRPRAMTTQQSSNDMVRPTRPGYMATPDSSSDNVNPPSPRAMATPQSSNDKVHPQQPSDDNVQLRRPESKTTPRVFNDSIEPITSTNKNDPFPKVYQRFQRQQGDETTVYGRPEVPDRDTKHETTLSGCTSEGLDSTSLPQAGVHRGRPFSDAVHPDQSVIDVTTRPASEFIPRRRRRDRFKEEGDVTKKSEKEKIEQDLRLQFGDRITDVMIQCVEDEHQRQQYDLKRNQVLKRLSKDIFDLDTVQKTLWFPTSSVMVADISKHGFNRNTCGHDGDYGDGVYFTTRPGPVHHTGTIPQHQGTPTPTDPHETQYVFRAKVLTGVSKLGTRGIRVLEDTEPGGLCDSTVDDLQSPSLYVVYNDTQAYPEYLIEYTVNDKLQDKEQKDLRNLTTAQISSFLQQ